MRAVLSLYEWRGHAGPLKHEEREGLKQQMSDKQLNRAVTLARAEWREQHEQDSSGFSLSISGERFSFPMTSTTL